MLNVLKLRDFRLVFIGSGIFLQGGQFTNAVWRCRYSRITGDRVDRISTGIKNFQ